jgi:uncharacterized OB-fold protein
VPEKLTVEAFYSEGKNGVLKGLRCKEGHVTVPPMHSCRICGSEELTLTQLSGRGTISSFTEVYSKSKEFPLETPYTLALVTLEEGGNLLGVIKSKPEMGLAVRVKFETVEASTKLIHEKDRPRIFFELT